MINPASRTKKIELSQIRKMFEAGIELKQKYYKELVKNNNGFPYGFDPEENDSNIKPTYTINLLKELVDNI